MVDSDHINTASLHMIAVNRHYLPAQEPFPPPDLDRYLKRLEAVPCSLRLLCHFFASKPPAIANLDIDIHSFRRLDNEDVKQFLDVLWESIGPILCRLRLYGSALNLKRMFLCPPYSLPRLKEFMLDISGWNRAIMNNKDIDNLELLFRSFSPTIENLCIFAYRRLAFALESILPYLEMPRLVAVEI
jgi:hypothetical protein